MEHLPFETIEERRLVLNAAKSGDRAAIRYLRDVHSCYVWTWEEIDALNLLLDSDAVNELTIHFNTLRERCKRDRSIICFLHWGVRTNEGGRKKKEED